MSTARLLRVAWLGGALAAGGVAPRAEVSVSSFFSDHLVLQAGAPVVIWGRAQPAEPVEIAVSWRQSAHRVTADTAGRWRTTMAPPAEAGPHEITLRSTNTIRIRDVLCGEVWICAGQSNMAMTMAYKHKDDRGVLDSEAEIQAAQHPGIRYFLVSRTKNASSPGPREDVEGEWKVCSPATAGDFSGVAYFFGEHLHRALRRPVGLIDTSWGGTHIQAWMSPAALASDPDFAPHLAWVRQGMEAFPAEQQKYEERLQAWRRDGSPADAKPIPPYWHAGHRNLPAGLFHARIAPLFPVSVSGALWYQGEGNASKAWLYQRLLPAMIHDWRSGWGREEMPFLIVQLPRLGVPGQPPKVVGISAWAELREAQLRTAQTVPHTHLAVALDAGEDHIHPRNKRPVGERLARLALAKVYGQEVVSSGPSYAGLRFEGGAAMVRFATGGSGLATRGGEGLRGFAVAGEDRRFHPAEAGIEGDTVIVRSPQVPMPVAVRYAWADDPDGNLFNRAGLPASPFRTDEWPESTHGLK
ncbi:MAG: sialate O-acetylesterase [Verrucomicrobia bacterium]|nr:sialate O-acetylesterase [Verrucomicrobiota bacterium]